MRVLIVKMSSMGDIVHTLPAVSDAANALPGIKFDWVAEEAFIEIPAWHKKVNRVIPIALRRWRKQPWHALKQGEVQRFYKQLRLQHYDKVIDAQGSIKSAVTTQLSHGFRLGMDKNSVRETFAYLAYQEKFSVPRKQHAIDRLRQLFAMAFEYPLPKTPPCYGIETDRLILTKLELPANYLIFVPNASWPAKCWPETSWASLLEKTANQQIPVYIPWVDTGLSHLATALGTPTITLYGPTDPNLIGTVGESQFHLPSAQKDKLEIPVETVWQTLQCLLKTSL